jgi:hypothetical protein
MTPTLLRWLRGTKKETAKNTHRKVKRIPLTIEQLEPIWLFNRGPIGLYEEFGAIRQEKLFDDLTQDFTLFGSDENRSNSGPASGSENPIQVATGGRAIGAVGNVTSADAGNSPPISPVGGGFPIQPNGIDALGTAKAEVIDANVPLPEMFVTLAA